MGGRLTLQTAGPKDQTYALYSLTQQQLSRTLMPLGELDEGRGITKEAVREIAARLGLLVANKPDSQEICFIPDNNYPKFLENYYKAPLPEGNFVDASGNILGRHKGIANYTIGQRKGLGVSFLEPKFVKLINPETNEVTLSSNEELFATDVVVGDVNMMGLEEITSPMECMGKLRYAHKMAPCVIEACKQGIFCRFKEPQRAITPGQAAVFYQDGKIICGGTILADCRNC